MSKRLLIIAMMAAGICMTAGAQSADELLSQGREAYENYEFDKAARLYAQAKKKVRKADEAFNHKYHQYEQQLTNARNFLERVENISVIDSITVPRQSFFKAYRIPKSAGSLSDGYALPSRNTKGVDYVFTNESEDFKLWAEPDTTGYMHLVESIRMTDGNWSEPTPLDDELSEEGDAIFPFMMADGVTLYYATNGEGSIGGYDIMVATRDASDGTFLQPSNMGFPYNSPFDDYLLAIDEQNGVGWWATDRNQLDDDITIYLFVVNDLRNNYPTDYPELLSMARIDDYIATQPEEADYDELLTTIRAIDPEQQGRKPEFSLPMAGGRTIQYYDDLPNMAARGAMRKYVNASAELEAAEYNLLDLRREYAGSHSASLASKIANAEKLIESQRAKAQQLRSELYRLLGNQ